MSCEVDDLKYLSESFDPASLTVPKLRNILLTHGVNYPSSARKQTLIELFNEKIVPRAKELLAAYKVEPSAEGITDASSSQIHIID